MSSPCLLLILLIPVDSCCILYLQLTFCLQLGANGAMYRFLVARFLVAIASHDFWPHYGGRREVTSLDGEWLFGFNASKDLDVLQEIAGYCSAVE
jgi:hypothetical protein